LPFFGSYYPNAIASAVIEALSSLIETTILPLADVVRLVKTPTLESTNEEKVFRLEKLLSTCALVRGTPSTVLSVNVAAI